MMCTKLIRIIIIVLLISTGSLHAIEKNNGVHLFVLSGQSNMEGMDPETGFMTEAEKLFKDEKVVYIKVAKGAQPICRWLEEWEDIAKDKGLDEKHRQRILKGEGVLLYQPILDQYKEMLKKYPKPASVTFCWMQGERDANGGAYPAYKDSLKLLISKLRRDLKRPDMNVVIGRLSDAAPDSPAWVAMRKIQLEIVDEDPSGAWVDCDDLNDKLVDGVMKSVVHYNRPEGYDVLGQRFAAQGYALIKGKKPAENGRPSISAVASAKSSDISKALAKPFERREADPNMPNIVFVMTDDQRRDGLGCYGRKDVHTPHIDKLAAQSVVFDNAYYNAAICMPSRVTMFTGRYFSDHRSGFTYPYNRTLTIEEFEDSYPAQLRKAGYRTGFIGKWGIRMAKGGELQSIHRRFFDFFCGRGGFSFPKDDEGLKHIYRKDRPAEERTIIKGDAMIRFLETQPEGQPFCLSISFDAVKNDRDHDMYPPHVELFKDKTMWIPENWSEGKDTKLPSVLDHWRGTSLHLRSTGTPELYQRVARRFAVQGYTVDQQVGRLMAKLEEMGFLHKTIVIYTSDNGRFHGSHGLMDKSILYEESMKAPLIIYDGRTAQSGRGRREQAMVSSVDMAPTMLSLAGLKVPKSMKGRDLSALLRGDQDMSKWRESVLLESLVLSDLLKRSPDIAELNSEIIAGNRSYRSRGVVTDRYKYFKYFEHDPVIEELYDLKVDPYEQNNLVKNPEYGGILSKLREETEKLYDQATK